MADKYLMALDAVRIGSLLDRQPDVKNSSPPRRLVLFHTAGLHPPRTSSTRSVLAGLCRCIRETLAKAGVGETSPQSFHRQREGLVALDKDGKELYAVPTGFPAAMEASRQEQLCENLPPVGHYPSGIFGWLAAVVQEEQTGSFRPIRHRPFDERLGAVPGFR